ncbi:MAG: DNA-3-methyladenine glycosylase 2 family protein [Clostridia bacterium]|nr:DNA-3-methyladenine glycosylase 2 family protein [Clostridia bacterium]
MRIGSEPLDLKLTLIDSAQCFRWVESGGWFGCVLDGRPVWLTETADGIAADTDADPAYLRHYLDLDRDYSAIAAMYADIPAARRAIELFPGLRVMNQPVWETLIGFVLSANNNVARIRGLTAALSGAYGARIDTPRGPLYGFPGPQALADAGEDALRALKVGYRAPFIAGIARRVLDGFPIDALRSLSYEDAHAALLTLPGVGDKVADCVQLFGCGHTCAFPVDVWVARLLRDWFGMADGSRAALARRARARLGDHAGILQQFLFHAARTGAMETLRTGSVEA